MGRKRYQKEKEIGNKQKAINKEENNHSEDEEEHNEIHFKAIEVIPGTTDLGFTEVKFVEEISTNAKIVIKGAFYLLATSKGGGAHEH